MGTGTRISARRRVSASFVVGAIVLASWVRFSRKRPVFASKQRIDAYARSQVIEGDRYDGFKATRCTHRRDRGWRGSGDRTGGTIGLTRRPRRRPGRPRRQSLLEATPARARGRPARRWRRSRALPGARAIAWIPLRTRRAPAR